MTNPGFSEKVQCLAGGVYLTAPGKDPGLIGALYPFPLIEDATPTLTPKVNTENLARLVRIAE